MVVATRSDATAAKRRPLDDVRVADFSWHGVGPYCTMMLAELGADVIKVETHERLDVSRRPHPVYGRMGLSPFEQLLAGKRFITLNMKTPRGLELARQLVCMSHVVMENFRPGVMDRLGLGYEALRALKPDIIMLSASAAGQTGPERGYTGYAPVFSALGGLGYLTGYEDGPPVGHRNQMDYSSGLVASFAVLAALRYRRKTGRGQHIDLASREVATTFVGEAIMAYTMNGEVAQRIGNADEIMAPHNVYRCAGEDRWLSIAVANDAEWAALCRAIGRPELVSDPRFSDGYRRWKHREQLDTIVEEWTRAQTPQSAMEALQAAGVAAMPSMSGRDLLDDPHLQARSAFPELDDPAGGRRHVVGPPWRFSATPASVDRWPPVIGADNLQVFHDLFGLSAAEIEQLVAEKVIY